MAAISLNHHLPNFLLHILLFFLYIHNLVQADEKLIDQTCKNTESPALCVHCIKSNAGGEKADTPVGIASITINCIINHTRILTKNTTDLAASHSSDKKFVAICQNCGKGYSRARKNLDTATAKLKKGDYDNANHFVTYALSDEDVQRCKPNLHNYERTIAPEGIFYQIRVYEELSGIAMSIIDRLKSSK